MHQRNFATVASVVACVVSGLVLLVLSAPRLVASVLLLPGDHVLTRIQKLAGSAPKEDLMTLVRSRKAALEWLDSGRIRTDLALAQILLAEAQGTVLRPAPNLAKGAARNLEIGLAKGPANTHAWARLALVRYRIDGATREVAKLVSMSALIGLNEPRLVFPRIGLSLVLWERFDKSERELVLRQVRYAWRIDPKRLVALARRSGQPLPIRVGLGRDRRELTKFERMYRRRN